MRNLHAVSGTLVTLTFVFTWLGGCAATDGGGAEDGPSDSDRFRTCDVELAGELDALGVPGLSVAIVKDGEIACASSAGLANIDDDVPVAPTSVFAWASVSKTVTATAAMILLDDGLFELDDDIGDYLPFATRNPNCADTPLTFRQLLTHTSSITDNLPVYEGAYTIGDSPIALGDFVGGYLAPGGQTYDAANNFLVDCPGAEYDYSNVASGLLGFLVEHIAGVPFDQFCRERIFSPLGMTEASFHLADLENANIAMPYDGSDSSSFTAHGHIGFPTFPDGLLRTSVIDQARFLAMVMAGGELEGKRILSRPTVGEMLRVQDADLDDTQALIWYYDYRSTLVGHIGSDPGTSSMMFFDPSDEVGVLIVANGDWYATEESEDAADSLLAALFAEARAK